jgi:hypothetical protein
VNFLTSGGVKSVWVEFIRGKSCFNCSVTPDTTLATNCWGSVTLFENLRWIYVEEDFGMIGGDWWLGIICSNEWLCSVFCGSFWGDETLKSINNKSSDIVGGFSGTGGGARVMTGLLFFDPFNWRTFDTTRI